MESTMVSNSEDWVNWRDYMPENVANNYDFGSVPIVEKFAFLLGKQALLIDKEIPVSIDQNRLAIARPILMGISSNAIASIKLAQRSFGNEVYPILRSLIERIITFYYLQVCDENELKSYVDYSKQKTYRLTTKKLEVNEKIFSVGLSEAVELDAFPELERAVEKFTSQKSKKPITRWSQTSIENKLSVIDKFRITNTKLLMITLTTIYDDASEALHATLYGCTFHLGAYQPYRQIQKPDDMSKHFLENLTMIFCLFGLLLGRINVYVAEKLGKNELKKIAEATDSQILNTMKKCLKLRK
jgi:hypothetical protein